MSDTTSDTVISVGDKSLRFVAKLQEIGYASQMDLFKQKNLLDGLSETELKIFRDHAKPRKYRRGTIIFEQEDIGQYTYWVESGWVKTYYTSLSGKDITVGLWTTGDLIGAPDLDFETRLLSAQVIHDATMLTFSSKDIEFFLANIPQFSRNLIAALSFKVRWATNIFDRLATESVLARVAQTVLSIAYAHGSVDRGHTLFIDSITHQDIADMVGASRPSTSLSLKKLEKSGFIRVSFRRIEILDPEGLMDRRYE